MTEPYTPSTNQMRDVYTWDRCVKHGRDDTLDTRTFRAEFDRWLARHDAEVKAAALRETPRPEMTGEWGVAFDLTNATVYEAYLSEIDARTIASKDPSGRALVHRFVTDWEETP